MNDEVTALIEKAIQAIQDKHDTREYKLAITKLQEALMWHREGLRALSERARNMLPADLRGQKP